MLNGVYLNPDERTQAVMKDGDTAICRCSRRLRPVSGRRVSARDGYNPSGVLSTLVNAVEGRPYTVDGLNITMKTAITGFT